MRRAQPELAVRQVRPVVRVEPEAALRRQGLAGRAVCPVQAVRLALAAVREELAVLPAQLAALLALAAVREGPAVLRLRPVREVWGPRELAVARERRQQRRQAHLRRARLRCPARSRSRCRQHRR